MIRIFLTSSIIFLLVFTSCISTKQNVVINKDTKTSDSSVVFNVLSQGTHSNEPTASYKVVNEEEYQNIFKQINSTQSPGIAIPVIAINKETILVLFMGMKGTGGHSIYISKVVNTGEEIIVYFKEEHPNGPATSVLTQPYFIASIAKTDLPIRFEKLN